MRSLEEELVMVDGFHEDEVNSKLASLAAAHSISNHSSGLTDLHRVSG